MRLFVAVRPPPELVPAVRDPHITLRFLGDVEASMVDEVAEALRSGLAGMGPCEATLGSTVRRLGPSALVRPVAGLDELAAAVSAAVGRYGGDDRPFRGHLTVARRRRGEPAPGEAGVATARWTVREVALVHSELGRGPGGTARHRDVATVALAGGS